MIHDKENIDAAKIAGEGKAEILFFQDALSRIIAHTCRQPGLSLVLTEFFDFGGDEFYFEQFPELAGHTFGEILNWFGESTVVGLEQGGKVLLNPSMNTVLGEKDSIIHLAEDDDTSKINLAYILEDISTSKNYITNFEGWFHSEYDDQPYYTVSGIKWEEVYGLHFDFYEKEY